MVAALGTPNRLPATAPSLPAHYEETATDRDQAKSASAMAREIDQLSAGLRVLRNESGLSPKMRGAVCRLCMANERLGAIEQNQLGGLIAFAGEDELVDATEALYESIGGLGDTIRDRKARVLAGKLPRLWMSRTHLVTLFFSLIDNAIKFQIQREPRVIVRAHPVGEQWVFSVSDNGMGIDAALDVDLFDMYQRGPEVEDFPGWGIGLALCRSIAACYGGHMWYESSLGKGSCFYCQLPVQAVTAKSNTFAVHHNGVEVGQVAVDDVTNKRQIVKAALGLPALAEGAGGAYDKVHACPQRRR